MRKWVGFMIVSLLFQVPVVVGAVELDGTAWRIHEKGKTDTEDLIFFDGQFISSRCVPYGFSTSDYSTSEEGNVVNWTAEQINDDDEKMVWNGTAKGKEIKGKYTFTDKKGKTWTSEWMGTKLEAK